MTNVYKGYNAGVLEAPADGVVYARLNGTWVSISGGAQEVYTFDTFGDFPVSGNLSCIYIAKDTKKIYTWDGVSYEELVTITSHNDLSSIQGGAVGEYYHLTEQQKSLVVGINSSISVSTLSPITVTDNGDGTVTTGNVLMILKNSTNLNAEAHGVLLAGIGPIALTIGQKYFLVGDWNSGTPIQRIESASAPTINDYTVGIIGILTRGVGGDIYYTDLGLIQVDGNSKTLRRIDDTQGLIVKALGGVVSSSAGRYLQITASRYYIANNRKSVSALDTTGANRFSTLYGDSTAGFTELTNVAQLNNTQYWDPSTHALTNLSVGRYSVRWIFQLIDSPDEVYEWIGTGQYTAIASARDALLTTDLPTQLQAFLNVSVLIAKVIVRQGQNDVIEVINIINTTSQSVTTSTHNDLAGLQGGTVNEYYHLTAAGHETLSELADGRFSPVSDSTTAFQVTKSDETTSVLNVDTTNSIVAVNGSFSFTNGAANKFIFSGTPTANRTLTFPNETGTVALLSQAQSVTWTAGTSAGPTLSVAGGTAVAIPSASATASGVVTTGAQEFAGTKTFANAIEFKNGTAYKFTFSGTPTADRTITMPNASGTVALLESNNVFTVGQTFNNTDTILQNGATNQRMILVGGTYSSGAYIDVRGSTFSVAPGSIYITATGNLVCTRVYSVTVTNAPRALNVDSNGIFGYVSSVRASKNKIDYNLDTSFLYDLKPVSFEYRLRNEAGEWLEETDGHQKIGLIAEDVDLVKPEMTYKSTEGVLEGVDYQYLIPALLKEIQNLNARLKVLEEGLNV